MDKPKKASIKTVLQAVVSLGEQVADIKNTMATKEYVETVAADLKQELTKEIRAIGKAVDKDAVTIIGHENRIVRIEKHLALK